MGKDEDVPGKTSLGFLVTKEGCSLEHSVPWVCQGPGRAADPSVGQLFIPGKHVGGQDGAEQCVKVWCVECMAVVKSGL